MQSDQKIRRRREAAKVLREIAGGTDDEHLRAEIEACADRIEAVAAKLETSGTTLPN